MDVMEGGGQQPAPRPRVHTSANSGGAFVALPNPQSDRETINLHRRFKANSTYQYLPDRSIVSRTETDMITAAENRREPWSYLQVCSCNLPTKPNQYGFSTWSQQ